MFLFHTMELWVVFRPYLKSSLYEDTCALSIAIPTVLQYTCSKIAVKLQMSILNLDPAKNGYFQGYNESSKNVTSVVEYLT